MERSELSPLLIVSDPEDRCLLKISRVAPSEPVTAEVVLPVPQRTTVQSYTDEEITRWSPPTDQQYRDYLDAWRGVCG